MIDPVEYDKCITLIRTFFKVKGFLELYTQSHLSILSVIDANPITFEFKHNTWPLPQNRDILLQSELLKDPQHVPGYFCITNYIQDETTLPIFEFQCKGSLDDIITLEYELLEFIGFKDNNFVNYTQEYYHKVAKDVAENRNRLTQVYGPVFFLKHTPIEKIPFWIEHQNAEIKNVHVIIHGLDTIRSSEHSCQPLIMRQQFDKSYANRLYSLFGKERVEKELDTFLNFTFIPRCGGSIHIGDMIRGMKLSHIM